jgi:ribosomal protein S1
MSKTIIYAKARNKYYNGGTQDVNFDFDANEMTDEQLENQRQLLDYILDIAPQNPINGNVYPLTYIGTNKESLLFDGGFKDYVRVENKPGELKYFKNLSQGDVVDILICGVNNKKYIIEGSIAQLYESKAHDTLKSLKEEESIKALIKELTPAGFNVELQHDTIILPGFMPNTLAGVNRLSDPESIVGKTMEVMIESFSKEEGTYIVSRRKYLEKLIPQAIKKLEFNKVYTGYVTGTTDFGVFVEFAPIEDGEICLTGMIHKSNIDPDWRDRLKTISAGYEIQFYIKEIAQKDSKLILTQILRETLWDTIQQDQIIKGKVKENKPFGALINLDNETMGLIHISELGDRILTPGQQIKVQVAGIDRTIRKIFLKLA